MICYTRSILIYKTLNTFSRILKTIDVVINVYNLCTTNVNLSIVYIYKNQC